MALDLDIWTAEFLSEELEGRPDLAVATLRQAIDIYTREKLQKILDGTNYDRWSEIPFTTKEQLCERLDALTPDELWQTAQEVFAPERITTLIFK